MNKQSFTEPMVYMQSIYGWTVPDMVRDQYWELFKSWDARQWKSAVEHVLQTFVPSQRVPFPVPAHFVKAAGGDPDARASLAIMKLRCAVHEHTKNETVDLGDTALHAVVQAEGGWPDVCDWTDEDWRYREHALKDAYKAAIAAKVIGPLHLKGTIALRPPANQRCLPTHPDDDIPPSDEDIAAFGREMRRLTNDKTSPVRDCRKPA